MAGFIALGSSAYTTKEGEKSYNIPLKENTRAPDSTPLAQHQQAMLDALATPVILCDAHFNLTYLNGKSLRMLDALALSAGSLGGFPFDSLPRHRHVEFQLGGAVLRLHATPLKNARGEFDGLFIDWHIACLSSTR